MIAALLAVLVVLLFVFLTIAARAMLRGKLWLFVALVLAILAVAALDHLIEALK